MDQAVLRRANIERLNLNMPEFNVDEKVRTHDRQMWRHAVILNPLETAAILLPALMILPAWVGTVAVVWNWIAIVVTLFLSIAVYGIVSALGRTKQLRPGVVNDVMLNSYCFLADMSLAGWVTRMTNICVLAAMWFSGRENQSIVIAFMWVLSMLIQASAKDKIEEMILDK